MRPPQPLCELTIKVPGPFEGVDELGFSARYPEQGRFAPLRDVPLWIEGPAQPLRRLHHRLRMLHEAIDGPYAWTDPVQLAEEVVIVAFRDRSLEPRSPEDYAQASLDLMLNLVRPVVFPFLADCARVAHLRLANRIEMTVEAADWPVAHFAMRVGQIVPENGFDLLGAA
ncbi:MAG TPA: hypothetical protein VF160_11705 [Candidatus Dormibacteraeota bacterium]